jgi:hypothetical protein
MSANDRLASLDPVADTTPLSAPQPSPTTSRGPDFLIVGAPKCGTTSLYTYLARHPQIFLPVIKEPHFFLHGVINTTEINDIDDYLSLFATAHDNQLCGEASSNYILHPRAIKSALTFNPKMKMIAMIRNPIDMIVSFHAQKVYSLQEEEADFIKAWQMSAQRRSGQSIPRHCVDPLTLDYQSIAQLGTRLGEFMEIVPKDQRHIVIFDDFIKTTPKSYSDVIDFLGVDYEEVDDFGKINPRKEHRWPTLARVLWHPPFPLNVIKAGLKRRYRNRMRQLGRKIYNLEARAVNGPNQNNDIRTFLRSELRGQIKILEDLIGRDFSYWLSGSQAD